jgi:hypothetical protein
VVTAVAVLAQLEAIAHPQLTEMAEQALRHQYLVLRLFMRAVAVAVNILVEQVAVLVVWVVAVQVLTEVLVMVYQVLQIGAAVEVAAVTQSAQQLLVLAVREW